MSSPFPSGREVWPDFAAEESSTVFSPRPPLRKLIVVIDYALLDAEYVRRSPAAELFAGLITHPYVEVFRVADDGPPPEVERLTTEVGVKYVPGWVVLGEPREGTGHVSLIQATEDGSNITRRTLIGNAHELAEADVESDAYPDLETVEAAARRVTDMRVLEAAIEVGADLLITERPYLNGLSWDFAQRVVSGPPESALPLVGLYLRRQGVYVTYRSADGSATFTLNRGLFYWVATRDLLPAGWRWLSACVRASDDGGLLGHLAQSALQRVDRALEERDAILWALNQPQDNDIAGDALDSLDGVLLRLMAALDVTARVAHLILGLSGDEYGAAWQKKKWVKKVVGPAPDLAALIAPGSRGAQTVEIVRLLRNSIHGAALRPLAVASSPGQRDATLVGLPPADARRVLAAMDALGGRSSFGVRQVLPDRFHADPGELVDEVFRRTVELLDALMNATPVERIAGDSIAETVTEPPADDIFGARNRESIRLQLGLL